MNDPFPLLSDLEVFTGTLVGESESLGEKGMTGTALTILNRVKTGLHWLTDGTIRGTCLRPFQYQCWEDANDLHRILNIINNNVLYGPYVTAMQIASTAMNYGLDDWTNNAVSYFDPPADPYWARGKTPCLIDVNRKYYDLKAIEK